MHSLLIVVAVLLSFEGNEAGLVRRYANSNQELLIPVAVITDEPNVFSVASGGSEAKLQTVSATDSAVAPSKSKEPSPADISIQENEVRDVFVNKLYEQKEVQLQKNAKHQSQILQQQLQQQQQQQQQQEQQPLQEKKTSEQYLKAGQNSVLSFVEANQEAGVEQNAAHGQAASFEETSPTAVLVKKADTSNEQEQQLRLSTVDPLAAEVDGDLPKAPDAPVDGQANLDDQDATQLRQNNQAAPVQTTPGNFVQQLIQNSPLRPIFNQLTGQNVQTVNEETAGATSPPALPGFFNPIQTVVNTTTQAFQGLQQFASNLGNQFQNTLSNLGGQGQPTQPQAQDAVASTNRPPGPIQQFVSSIIGGNNPSNAQQQTQSQPQRPLQNILSIFQGNRPQQTSTNTNKPANSDQTDSQSNSQPAELSTLAADTDADTGADADANVADDAGNAGGAGGAGEAAAGENNENNPVVDPIEDDKNKRRKVPIEDSFEDGEADANDEVIVVNDDAAQTVNHHHYFHHQYDRPDETYPSDPGYSAAVPY